MCSMLTAVATPEAAADAAFDAACAHLENLAPRSRVALVERYRRRLDAVEASTLAEGVVGPPTTKGSARNAFRLAQHAGVSSAEQRRRVNRARAVAENPAIADRMTSGQLGTDQLDAVARASRRTDGHAARDESLLDEIAAAEPDQANRIANAWVEDHLSDDEVQAEHDRQRGLRYARKGTDENGLATITLAGDRESIDTAWRVVQQRADALYRADGGRDVPVDDHERTTAQRYFDAAIDVITTTGLASPSTRPTLVFSARVDDDGKVSAPTLAGTGRVPNHVFERFRCDAQLVAMIEDHSGQPLWLSRGVRTVSGAQWTALVVRDQGCVLCGADHVRCEAHHLIPYNSPKRGDTDIDNLALLCSSCHHAVHERRQTLVRGPDGDWKLRSATPDETPPPRPAAPQTQHRHHRRTAPRRPPLRQNANGPAEAEPA